MLGTAHGGVERKRACVRKAVKHSFALGKPRNGKAVILLVEEEARFLPVFDIDTVINPVFANLRDAAFGVLAAEPALVLLKSLQFTDFNIVALKNTAYFLTVGAQDIGNQRKQHGL